MSRCHGNARRSHSAHAHCVQPHRIAMPLATLPLGGPHIAEDGTLLTTQHVELSRDHLEHLVHKTIMSHIGDNAVPNCLNLHFQTRTLTCAPAFDENNIDFDLIGHPDCPIPGLASDASATVRASNKSGHTGPISGSSPPAAGSVPGKILQCLVDVVSKQVLISQRQETLLRAIHQTRPWAHGISQAVAPQLEMLVNDALLPGLNQVTFQTKNARCN